MKIKLAFGIKKHSYFDYICVPYLIKENTDKKYISILTQVSESDFEKYSFLNEKWIQLIFNNSKKLTITNLNKRYNKKHLKLNFDKFYSKLKSLEKKAITKNFYFINDIIAKQITKNEPLLFIYEKHKKNYFENDFLKYSKDKLNVNFIFSKKEKDNTFYFTYSLDVLLYNKKIPLNKTIVLNDKNPLLIYKNSVFQFDNTKFNGAKIKPFQTKNELIIPSRSSALFFNKFVKYALNKFNYQLENIDIIKPKVELTPILDLEKDIHGNIIFSVSFLYNHKKTSFYGSDEIFSKIIEKDGDFLIEQVKRNKQKEKEYLKILDTLGFTKLDTHFTLKTKSNNPYEVLKKNDVLFLKLSKIGFKINNRLLKKESVFESEKILSTIKSNRDWFDITISIKIKDYIIPFINFKEHILSQNQEYILPDNTIFIIPKEWFSQLSEFAKRTFKTNQIRLHKQNYHLLDNQNVIQLEKNIQQNIENLKTIKEIALPKKSIATLRNYQLYGYQWLYNRVFNNFGVCLADDMGLGKTLQILTLLKRFFEDANSNVSANINGQLDLFSINETIETLKTVLIVLPRVLIQNWKDELRKFAPELSYFSYYGTNRKETFMANFQKKHIAITSYGVIRNDIDFLQNYTFSFFILDESHAIKNPKSLIFKAVTKINSTYKISITGTPFENKLSDIWAQFYFLNPELLGNYAFFNKEYIQKIKNNPKADEVSNLKQIIDPFILRRLKENVAKELPEKIINTHYCELLEEQKKFYESEKSAIRNEILKQENKKNKIKILAGLTKLRQIALHPKLINTKLDYNSGKYQSILLFIENLMAQNHKFIIFSSYVSFLNLFKEYFESNNISYKMLTGKSKNPQNIVAEYQENTSVLPFLISIKAGGVGLNITSANYVIISDPWWNPFVEQQAIDRTHRIGQTKNVFVYKFITKDTIEEKIQKIQQEKQDISKALFTQDNFITDNTTLLTLLA